MYYKQVQLLSRYKKAPLLPLGERPSQKPIVKSLFVLGNHLLKPATTDGAQGWYVVLCLLISR
ncbi:MAG: hypothetical protein RIQ78_1640 [Bacteroidota bacterium]|jgi:hypothetical protein